MHWKQVILGSVDILHIRVCTTLHLKKEVLGSVASYSIHQSLYVRALETGGSGIIDSYSIHQSLYVRTFEIGNSG